MIGLAAAAAGLAVLLALPRPARLIRRAEPFPRWAVPTAAGAVLGLALERNPETAALLAIAASAAAGAAVLIRRQRHRRAAAAASARVLETCELLAAELSAGQPPGPALRRSARGWPELLPVAETHDLGGDASVALRTLSARPGLHDLRLVAAAWSVAHRTGGGLADALQRCADTIRAAQATRRVVVGELASARSTARLVAGLPVLALAMGAGTGGDPVGFLTGHPIGLACLTAGLACGFAGLWWIEAIADDVEAGA